MNCADELLESRSAKRGDQAHDGLMVAHEEPIWLKGRRVYLLALPVTKDGIRRWVWEELYPRQRTAA